MHGRPIFFPTYVIATALLVAASAVSRPVSAQDRVTRRSDNRTSSELSSDEVLLLYGFGKSGRTSKAAENAVRDFLAEREAVAKFLAKRRVTATDEAIERRLDKVRRALAMQDVTLEQALERSGIAETTLRRALAVPVAWNEYLRLTLTEEAIKAEFDAHRPRYDGSEVLIKQIFFPAAGQPVASSGTGNNDGSASGAAAEAVRERIATGGIDFDQAWKQSEQLESADAIEADWVRFRGDVAPAVAAWGFDADVGDISPVLSSPFGSHIVTLLDTKSGERSLEDCRAVVIKTLSDRLWAKAVAASGR